MYRFCPLQTAHLLMHYNLWSTHAWWLVRPFLLGSASWPRWDQERRSCTHTCPYVSCFPLWNSIELTTGIPWQSGQKLFSFLEDFFWICLCFFLFLLSVLCPCSPCITTSRYVVPTEGLPGYHLCRICLLHMSSFQRCFKALSFYHLHPTSMAAAASGALSGKQERAQLWRANLPSGTVYETKVSIMWEKWPGYVSMVGVLLVWRMACPEFLVRSYHCPCL